MHACVCVCVNGRLPRYRLIDGKRVKVTRLIGSLLPEQPAASTAVPPHSSDIASSPTTFIHFTSQFKHLGSMITPSLTSDLDAEIRIKKVSQAFGALRSVVCGRDPKAKTRGIVHEALVVIALLHGAECRAMKDSHMRAITSFHNRCVRPMCYVAMRTTQQFHIKATTQAPREISPPAPPFNCVKW